MSENNALSHVGVNIRSIRRRRHLSQVELAGMLGMRPGPVNCIEKGRNLPSARVLKKLSEVLNVPIDAFFVEPPSSGPARVCESAAAYVAGSGAVVGKGPCAVPARTSAEQVLLAPELCRHASNLADIFLTLEDLCGARKTAEIPLDIPFDQSEEGLQRLCERVRKLLGVSDAVIFDYLELFENAGLRVIFSKLPGDAQSISCHDEANGNAFIFISTASRMTVERQLFRLCYELGRLYVHAPGRARRGVPVIAGHDARGKEFNAERTARRFAALFLMPAAALKITVAQLGIGPSGWSLELLYRIKHRFGVSAEALLYRLGELTLIETKLQGRLKTAIHAWYASNGHNEPDESRRILSPNGRLGDLLHIAGKQHGTDAEVRDLRRLLTKMQLPGLEAVSAQSVTYNCGTIYPKGDE